MITIPDCVGTAPCPEAGIHRDIPNDEYHSWKAANHSTINKFFVSAADGVVEIESERKVSDDLDFGNAFHARLLEPDRYRDQYVIFDPMDGPINKNTGKPYGKESAKYTEWLAEWRESLDGREVINQDDADRIEEMVGAVKKNRYAARFATDGYKDRELSIVWYERVIIDGKEIEVPCKARIDLYIPMLGGEINAPAFMDVKTAREVEYSKFQRVMWDRGYHRQMAWYLRGLHMCGLMPSIHEYAGMIMACLKTPPFHVQVYPIGIESITQGIHEHAFNLKRFARWCVTGDAPGLPDMPRAMNIPHWHQMPDNMESTTNIEGNML